LGGSCCELTGYFPSTFFPLLATQAAIANNQFFRHPDRRWPLAKKAARVLAVTPARGRTTSGKAHPQPRPQANISGQHQPTRPLHPGRLPKTAKNPSYGRVRRKMAEDRLIAERLAKAPRGLQSSGNPNPPFQVSAPKPRRGPVRQNCPGGRQQCPMRGHQGCSKKGDKNPKTLSSGAGCHFQKRKGFRPPGRYDAAGGPAPPRLCDCAELRNKPAIKNLPAALGALDSPEKQASLETASLAGWPFGAKWA